MKISPVSFGRAVKVNGSKDSAYDIARLANEKKVSKSERAAQKEAKAIFDDTDIAKAQVVCETGSRGKECVFIVSGKESLELDRLNDKLTNGIILAGDVFGNGEKFTKSCDKQIRKHNFDVHGLLLNSVEKFDINAIYNPKKTSVKSVNCRYDKNI